MCADRRRSGQVIGEVGGPPSRPGGRRPLADGGPEPGPCRVALRSPGTTLWTAAWDSASALLVDDPDLAAVEGHALAVRQGEGRARLLVGRSHFVSYALPSRSTVASPLPTVFSYGVPPSSGGISTFCTTTVLPPSRFPPVLFAGSPSKEASQRSSSADQLKVVCAEP